MSTLKIVITGKLSSLREDFMKQIAENYPNVEFQKAITKETDLLVTGADVGTAKTAKATKVSIILQLFVYVVCPIIS